MTLALLVGVVAGLGAVARYVVDSVVMHRYDGAFPLGTFTVNVTGSLLLGVVTGLARRHGLASDVTVLAAAGFCGGYTTWSTFAYESLGLAETGALLAATANLLLSVAAGLAAAAAGYALTLVGSG